MKKIFFAFILLFASSLVLFISCDKESVTPLIPEENQGIIYKEQGGSVQICCYQHETIYYEEGDQMACCYPGFGCLPCFIVTTSHVYQELNILESMLSEQKPSVKDFFSDSQNYETIFPALLSIEYANYLDKLKSGNFILVDILIDNNTNNRVYVFENKNTGERICLIVNLI